MFPLSINKIYMNKNNILRFDISMQYFMLMHKRDSV